MITKEDIQYVTAVVTQTIHKNGYLFVDRDDLIQVGLEAFIRCTLRFTPGEGRSIYKFSYLRIIGSVTDYIRVEKPKLRATGGKDFKTMHRIPYAAKVYDDGLAVSLMVSKDPSAEDILAEKEYKAQVAEWISTIEAPREREACTLRLIHGKSLIEVGEAMGVTESCACIHVGNAMKKLRKIALEMGLDV